MCLRFSEMFAQLVLLVCLAFGHVASLPSPTIDARSSKYTDPAYSVATSKLASSLTCPRGIQGKKGGVVFLVHGTGVYSSVFDFASLILTLR